MATPRLFLPNENRILDLFGATLHFKATASDTNGGYSVIDGAFDPGGFAPLPHSHDAEDESFYVLDGEFSFRIGESESVGRPGDLLVAARGVPHGFAASGDRRSRLLIIHSPSIEGFFIEMAKLSAAGPPEPATIGPVMQAWGMQLVSHTQAGMP